MNAISEGLQLWLFLGYRRDQLTKTGNCYRISANAADEVLCRVQNPHGLGLNAPKVRHELDRMIAQGLKPHHIYVSEQGAACYDREAETSDIDRFVFRRR